VSKPWERVRCIALLILLALSTACSGSRPRADNPATVTALMWMPESNRLDQDIAREFTQKTGISVRLIPGSESAPRRLAQEMALLEQGSSAVDVFQVDTIWPGAVADYMLDLKDVLRDELTGELPQVVENATVSGRLIAAPFYVDYSMLYYRTDLLQKYGFSHPPRTWDELELQSSRIQKGERAGGRQDFWGYIWQGAQYEGLTCNALEWQSSQGGRNLLSPDHSVNVANPRAVRAFSRAARWVGTISPPGVVAYIEEDSRNIWQSGRAAFLRNWSYVYPLAKRSREVGNRFSVAPMPVGVDRHSSVLGGWYLGVSKNAPHRREAIAFIRYMTSREAQKRRAVEGGFLPTISSLYQDSDVLRANPFLAGISDVPNRVIRRPASLVGAKYARVSEAYAHGVHTILTGQISASTGAGNIQSELERLTGFSRPVEASARPVKQEHP